MSKFVLCLWSADRLDHHSPVLPVSGRSETQNVAYLMKTQITQNQPTLHPMSTNLTPKLRWSDRKLHPLHYNDMINLAVGPTNFGVNLRIYDE